MAAIKRMPKVKKAVKSKVKKPATLIVKTKAIKDKQTRVEVLQVISDATNLKRVQVEAVFVELSKLIKGHMKKKGSGEFTIPWAGIKLCRRRRKPTKKRMMVSPLTGTEVMIPAKPARDDVKLVALKKLKECVGE